MCISDERAERYCASVTGGLGLDATGDSGAIVGADTRLDADDSDDKEGKQAGLSVMLAKVMYSSV